MSDLRSCIFKVTRHSEFIDTLYLGNQHYFYINKEVIGCRTKKKIMSNFSYSTDEGNEAPLWWNDWTPFTQINQISNVVFTEM